MHRRCLQWYQILFFLIFWHYYHYTSWYFFYVSDCWWSFVDSKSPPVFRTLPSILAYLNSTEVWMVSFLPLISNCSSIFSKPFMTVPHTLITIVIIVTHKILCYFLVLWLDPIICLFLTFFFHTSVVHWNLKIHYTASSPFFLAN